MRGENTKDRILNVAYEKFLKYGFFKVSMDSIVQELKTSKSSLYNHFASKEDLVMAVVEKINSEINHNVEVIIKNNDFTFREKLVSISKFTRSMFSKVSEVFLEDLELSKPGVGEYYEKERNARIQKYYRRLFETGVEEGLVRKDIKIDLILTMYLHLTLMPLRSEFQKILDMDNEDIYTDVQEVFLNGILKN